MAEGSLAEAIAVCDEPRVMELLRSRLADGVPPVEILAECNRGMIELGNRFNREECFLPDLMFGGMIMKNVMAELGPRLGPGEAETATHKATAVIGTVQHDVHDIGKDIVVMMLRGAGFKVVDLGVDTPPEKFVEAIREHRPVVVGMSLLLTTVYSSVLATVEAIRSAGLRDGLALMVGGAAASELLAEKAGCDFYGKTAADGLRYACQVADIAQA
ncbi:MAG: 5-methyltetrahydrofolate--homocysteine methyltransferase [Thermogutta sp.]|nr:5-methyltetrahydrofolate--homocysteine methyltransferase [Thermogutta sp.]